jgi:hypothetical protein
MQVFPEDLFEVLGRQKRPDFRWFVMGAARTGTTFQLCSAALCSRDKM